MVKTKQVNSHTYSRKHPVVFRKDWEVKFCLQVSTRDPVTKLATSALCLMCRNFGREDDEEGENRKQKKLASISFSRHHGVPTTSQDIYCSSTTPSGPNTRRCYTLTSYHFFQKVNRQNLLRCDRLCNHRQAFMPV
jgi:hypothetical protein